jgi:hypothetical protein
LKSYKESIVITTIGQINNRPVDFDSRELTIEGVCRTACERPFSHFTIEDKTGTLIVGSMNGLPRIGTHLVITGEFKINVPTNCTIAVPRLDEASRTDIGQHSDCSFVGCEFESKDHAVAA